MPKRALIIDDEADIRELIALSLDRIGLDTYTAANLEEARHLVDAYHFDVCLTDMRLPDGNGVDFVKYLQGIRPTLPVAVITAHGNMDAAIEAMKNGAFDFVSKPVDLKLLRRLVTQAISANENRDSTQVESQQSVQSEFDSKPLETNKPDTNQLQATALQDIDATHGTPNNENNELEKQQSTLASLAGHTDENISAEPSIGEGKLIGRSEPMQALRSMIAKVARTNAPVWITGESGTGKELIARLVHENSPRANAPFIAINCGAIPSELMESEMFGHRKGSFTGAHTDHDGLFRRAEGGTLFLDEVAELPLHMQVKLLRAIQERSIRPVGDTDEISTDVRILSASHKDLSQEVDNGNFRHDLYYRLNVICIRAPSLRDRSSDVPEIARHILNAIVRKEGRTELPILTTEAESELIAYPFPGNVRELENILERAVALSEGNLIGGDDLNLNVSHSPIAGSTRASVGSSQTNLPSEKQRIEDTLLKLRWNRKATALKLGMTYRQLRYRIQQYGIDEKTGS